LDVRELELLPAVPRATRAFGFAASWLLAFGLAVTSTAAASAQRTVALGGRDVVVWTPGNSGAGRQPVLIFSHGFGGCAQQSKFMTEVLAAHGYWVFAPNHKDARCASGSRTGGSPPDEPFRSPQSWSDQTFADRRDDIRAIQEALATNPAYATRVDLGRLGYIGHSLGGYTVVGLAGGWPSWQMPGVKAVLALSPYTEPYLVHGTLGGLSAPVMYQGGTLDFGITPTLRKPGGVYDASPSPKYFVDFNRAGHLAWTDLRTTAHGEINEYAIAFLDHYVRGVSASSTLTQRLSGVSELRYDSELGHATSSAERAGRRARARP
jgi:dienelactone hydrolase